MSISKVREYFRQFDMEDRILEMEQSSATVEQPRQWEWSRLGLQKPYPSK